MYFGSYHHGKNGINSIIIQHHLWQTHDIMSGIFSGPSSVLQCVALWVGLQYDNLFITLMTIYNAFWELIWPDMILHNLLMQAMFLECPNPWLPKLWCWIRWTMFIFHNSPCPIAPYIDPPSSPTSAATSTKLWCRSSSSTSKPSSLSFVPTSLPLLHQSTNGWHTWDDSHCSRDMVELDSPLNSSLLSRHKSASPLSQAGQLSQYSQQESLHPASWFPDNWVWPHSHQSISMLNPSTLLPNHLSNLLSSKLSCHQEMSPQENWPFLFPWFFSLCQFITLN